MRRVVRAIETVGLRLWAGLEVWVAQAHRNFGYPLIIKY